MMASDPDLQNPLINVNMSNVTKLSSMNYLTWRSEIKTLLREYNLMEFIDESIKPPPATITIDGETAPNPALTSWQAQDRLIYSGLISAIETPHQPLIATPTTSLKAWTTLASTYENQSTRLVDKYMKTKEDALDRNKEELGTESYKEEQKTLQALERKHQKEMRLRKETEYSLAIEQERIEKLELRLGSLKKDHDNTRLKAEEFESHYNSELVLRKESEIALEKERNELEAMKQLHETCKAEQDCLTSQVSTWKEKYDQESSLRKETEEALSREKEELGIVQELLEFYNKETDAMREERDNAREVLEEIITKQLENPPDSFICPITQEVMEDPQVAADGFTYEAEAIKEWFSTGNKTSPMTSLNLPNQTLVPNRTLRSAIQKFRSDSSCSSSGLVPR